MKLYDGRLGVVVAELSGEVLRLRRQLAEQTALLAQFRADLAQEIHTKRIVVADSHSTVEITPSQVDIDRAPLPGDPMSGSFIHLTACAHAAALTVGSATGSGRAPDSDLTTALYAGSETSAGEAFLLVQAFEQEPGGLSRCCSRGQMAT